MRERVGGEVETMIDIIEDLPGGSVGFRLHGLVSGDDYDRVLMPRLEMAIQEHDHVKALFCLGDDFEGYSLSAAWDDTLLGLRHWRGFERVAVLSDVGWIRTTTRALGALWPCPVKLFSSGDEQAARLWLGESQGGIHLEEQSGVIHMKLIGRLEPSAYDHVDTDLMTLFSRAKDVKLLIDLGDFDGWSGLHALGEHLSLIREHRRIPRRVAVVGNQAWQHLVQKLLSRFIAAETRFFDNAHREQAELWIQAS